VAEPLVVVTVVGGVAYLREIPRGVRVRVVDYDVEGVEEDSLDLDDDGNPCVVSEYENSSGET
jgi:hypothetical protein